MFLARQVASTMFGMWKPGQDLSSPCTCSLHGWHFSQTSPYLSFSLQIVGMRKTGSRSFSHPTAFKEMWVTSKDSCHDLNWPSICLCSGSKSSKGRWFICYLFLCSVSRSLVAIWTSSRGFGLLGLECCWNSQSWWLKSYQESSESCNVKVNQKVSQPRRMLSHKYWHSRKGLFYLGRLDCCKQTASSSTQCLVMSRSEWQHAGGQRNRGVAWHEDTHKVCGSDNHTNNHYHYG